MSHYRPAPGEGINSVATRIVKLAQKEKVPVTTEYCGVSLRALPSSTVNELVIEYQRKRGAKIEAERTMKRPGAADRIAEEILRRRR